MISQSRIRVTLLATRASSLAITTHVDPRSTCLGQGQPAKEQLFSWTGFRGQDQIPSHCFDFHLVRVRAACPGGAAHASRIAVFTAVTS